MSEWTEPEGHTVELLGVNRDAGSVVLFDATADDGRPVLVAVGHREAQAIADSLAAGGPSWAVVESWQVLG